MRKAIVIALAVVLVAIAGALPAVAGPASGATLPRSDAQTDRGPYDPQVSNAPGPRRVSYWGTPDANNTYEYYEMLGVEVEFSEAVSVTGAPYLELQIGSAVKNAPYYEGSGTATIRFQYRVDDGDNDPDGFSVNRDAGINLNGGSIRTVALPPRVASTHFSYTTVSGSVVTSRLVILPVNNPLHKVRGVNSIPSFGTASVTEPRYTPGVAIDELDLPQATGGDGALTYGLNSVGQPPCGPAAGATGASGAAGASGASVTAIPNWMSYYAPGTTYKGANVTRGGKIAPDITKTPDKSGRYCLQLYAADADRDTSSDDRAVLSFSVVVLTDYDSDNDGLIDVDSLAKLNAIRWDLNGDGSVDTGTSVADTAKYSAAFSDAMAGMGCSRDHDGDATTPNVAGCIGYELTANLDFDENNDGSITSADDDYWNGGKGWTPIGNATTPFVSTLEGNNKTISNLFINSTDDTANVGLFGVIGKCNGNICTGGVIKKLGLISASVTRTHNSRGRVGSLAGMLLSGEAISCYATGLVSHTPGSASSTGGLIGNVEGAGKVTASYATASVTGGGTTGTGRNRIGGLVGRSSGTITASYAAGYVAETGRAISGGLVGHNNHRDGGVITASYAIGAVQRPGGGAGGGLVRVITRPSNGNGGVTSSYWDTGTTGRSGSSSGTRKTTRELQSPQEFPATQRYTGIYANWDVDLDGDSVGDDPWHFGTDRQYPALKYGGLDPAKQRQTAIRSDNWNAPVVGEPVVAKLTGGSGNWKWYRLVGADWTLIAGSATTGAASSVYVPVTADVGKHLRAEVTFGSQTLTTLNTAKVLATTPAAAATAAPGPAVGVRIQYGLPISGATYYAWRWQRCDNAGMTTNCVYVAASTAAAAEYTPAAGDAGKYLRAYVYYAANDDAKTWTRAQTLVLGPVAAAPAASP